MIPFEPVPSYFFESGEFEVWAAKSTDSQSPIVLIADNLSELAAKQFRWPRMEIRRKQKAGAK